MTKKTWHYPLEIGDFGIVEEGGAITRIFLWEGSLADAVEEETPLLREAGRQLGEYCAGRRARFDLPLSPAGTEFQQRVWASLQSIPFGETRTYGQIAAEIGSPKACRAVGMANHCNPIMIAIPCHRVVGQGGKLTGYAGGLALKAALLDLEQRASKGG